MKFAQIFDSVSSFLLYTSNTLSEWGAYTSTQNPLDTYITRASSPATMGPSPYIPNTISKYAAECRYQQRNGLSSFEAQNPGPL